MSDPSKLIFVYNANSGKLNAFMDTLHKKLSPSTYQCNLCQITYGTFTEMPEWKEFRESFPGEMRFLHIDEFEEEFPKEESYPVVLEQSSDGSLKTVMSSKRVESIGELKELIQFFKDWAKLQ
jgi:hypothetical protein